MSSPLINYVRELIRDDEKRRAQKQLEAPLLAGLESGDATKMTPEDWIEIRQEGLKRLQTESHATRPNGPDPS